MCEGHECAAMESRHTSVMMDFAPALFLPFGQRRPLCEMHEGELGVLHSLRMAHHLRHHDTPSEASTSTAFVQWDSVHGGRREHNNTYIPLEREHTADAAPVVPPVHFTRTLQLVVEGKLVIVLGNNLLCVHTHAAVRCTQDRMPYTAAFKHTHTRNARVRCSLPVSYSRQGVCQTVYSSSGVSVQHNKHCQFTHTHTHTHTHTMRAGKRSPLCDRQRRIQTSWTDVLIPQAHPRSCIETVR